MPRFALLVVVALLVAGCGGSGDGEDGGRASGGSTTAAPATTGTAPGEPDEGPVRAQGDFRVETVATGLEVPWDMVFLPDGRALVTERPGRVRLLEADGSLRDEPVARPEVQARGEGGLLGIDLDPQFASGRRFAYLYLTTADDMEVQRWRVAQDGSMERVAVVLGGIEAGPVHDSGRLRFGPEGDLWVATGDAGRRDLAAQRESLNGKFLRLTPEQYRGRTDSPEIVSIGHRNPQGLDWQPGSGRLWASEHGPSGFDGPFCCDEINIVRDGGHYGWPVVFGDDHGRFRSPVFLWGEPPEAPAGAAFVSLPGSPWTGDLFVAALRGRKLHRLHVDGADVTRDEELLAGEYGRLRAVVEGPDGALYVTTSNRDGRGDPGEGDDRILRVVPPAG